MIAVVVTAVMIVVAFPLWWLGLILRLVRQPRR